MYLKSDISFYVFHVVCGLHYDIVSSHARTTVVPLGQHHVELAAEPPQFS